VSLVAENGVAHLWIAIGVAWAHSPEVRDFTCSRSAPVEGHFLNNVEFGRKAAPTRPRDVARRADAGRRIQEIQDMATGVVKFFNVQKGFGFIQPEDGGRDVFVHISAVERSGMSTLREGQKIKYDVISERGKQAAANLQEV
jgi:CspA family cold shock protein